MRVATYNIHRGLGVDGAHDLERTARTINALRAEIVALQEVDQGLGRSGWVDQPRVLEELTGLHVSFLPTLEMDGGLFGIALAAREPLQVDARVLPGLGEDRPHGLIAAPWRGVTVAGTHLSRRRRTRNLELEAMVERLRDAGPVVVMGDFNLKPSPLKRRLASAGFEFPNETTPTFPSTGPRRQIDFILGARGARVHGHRTEPSTASDHLPLIAEVESE